jgi:hypothetical protein
MKNEDRIKAEGPMPPPRRPDDAEPPELALWKPTMTALFLFGIISGAVIGAADGMMFYFIAGGFDSPRDASLWGAGLGGIGGLFMVYARRAYWGPDLSAAVASQLGLLYGVAPGAAFLYHCIFVTGVIGTSSLVGIVMGCSMIGLLIGGLLDRITDAVIANVKAFQDAG